MKKVYLILAMVAFASAAFAQMDVYDTVTVKTLSAPRLVDTAYTNAAVDVATAKGNCSVIFYLGAATTNAADYSCTATLKHSATAGGTYTAVTNGAGAEVSATTTNHVGVGTVTAIKVEAENLLRYVKLYVENENDTGEAGAVMLYKK